MKNTALLLTLLFAVPASATVEITNWDNVPVQEVAESLPMPAPLQALSLDDAHLRALAAKLADRANAAEGQTMVGEFDSYTCKKGKAGITCDFKYQLARGICWYGYEHITVLLGSSKPHPVISTERGWSAD